MLGHVSAVMVLVRYVDLFDHDVDAFAERLDGFEHSLLRILV